MDDWAPCVRCRRLRPLSKLDCVVHDLRHVFDAYHGTMLLSVRTCIDHPDCVVYGPKYTLETVRLIRECSHSFVKIVSVIGLETKFQKPAKVHHG